MVAFTPGVYTALVTPFSPDGSAIDWEAFDKLMASQLEGKIAGLIPCGTTGESATLGESEHREIARRTVKLANGRAKVVVGTGSNNTKKTIETSRAAMEMGAAGIMLVMPYYNRPSQEGLYRHVHAVATEVGGPVMLYNIPSRASVDLQVETLLRILDACPNVMALKDASGNVLYCQELLHRAGDRITVYSGDELLTLPLMTVGGKGVVSVTSNLYPREVSEVVEDALLGQFDAARVKNRRLYPVHTAMFSEPSPQPIKAALALKGRMSGSLRAPLVEAGPACRARLVEAMGVFEAS